MLKQVCILMQSVNIFCDNLNWRLFPWNFHLKNQLPLTRQHLFSRSNSISVLSSHSSNFPTSLSALHVESEFNENQKSSKYPLTSLAKGRERKIVWKIVWKIVCHKNFTRGDHLVTMIQSKCYFSHRNYFHLPTDSTRWYNDFSELALLCFSDVVFSLTKHFSTSFYFLFIFLRQ